MRTISIAAASVKPSLPSCIRS